jgi:hypothetical protein
MKNRSRLIFLVVLVALALAALACDASFSTTPTTTDFRVINNSSIEICYVQVSPVNNDTWGEDWLGKDTTIPAGTEYVIKAVANGSYDIRALDCKQNEITSEKNVTFDGTEISWTLTDK